MLRLFQSIIQQQYQYFVNNNMKHKPPSQQHRLLLSNICQNLNLSFQTFHNTIRILMNPKINNQNIDVCITALFICQKFHEVTPYSIAQLCKFCQCIPSNILTLQQTIQTALTWNLSSTNLLIDICFQIAKQWDMFINGITCINVRFLSTDRHVQECDHMGLLIMNFGRKCLEQACEGLEYSGCLYQGGKQMSGWRIAVAVVVLTIREVERYHMRVLMNKKKYILNNNESLIKISRKQENTAKPIKKVNKKQQKKAQKQNNNCLNIPNPKTHVIPNQKHNQSWKDQLQHHPHIETSSKQQQSTHTFNINIKDSKQPEFKKIISKSLLKVRFEHKQNLSTQFIIQDFINTLFYFDLKEFQPQIQYVRRNVPIFAG